MEFMLIISNLLMEPILVFWWPYQISVIKEPNPKFGPCYLSEYDLEKKQYILENFNLLSVDFITLSLVIIIIDTVLITKLSIYIRC